MSPFLVLTSAVGVLLVVVSETSQEEKGGTEEGGERAKGRWEDINHLFFLTGIIVHGVELPLPPLVLPPGVSATDCNGSATAYTPPVTGEKKEKKAKPENAATAEKQKEKENHKQKQNEKEKKKEQKAEKVSNNNNNNAAPTLKKSKALKLK